jgi:hypothetical protein
VTMDGLLLGENNRDGKDFFDFPSRAFRAILKLRTCPKRWQPKASRSYLEYGPPHRTRPPTWWRVMLPA